MARPRKKNPVPSSSALQGKKEKILRGSRLYEDFTGDEVKDAFLLDKPEFPDVLLEIGKIDGIMYTTKRDGRVEKYIHEFKASARPTFAVTPDGQQIVLLGGSYTFTERGIVDKRN